jgi:U3 small nucleolar RNA-associated protein MPP10
MKRELIFEDVQDKVLGILGVPVEKRKTVIINEEENEEAMGEPEEAGEEMENETPEEEAEEEGDVDIEGMSYEDKMSLVLEIVDSFEDEDEQVKFIEELQDELSGMVEDEGEEEEEEEEDMEEEEGSDMPEEEDDFE